MRHIFLILLATGFSGCATPKIFHWGAYESVLYKSYISEGKFSTGEQIDILQKEIEAAQSKEAKVAPGIYAHLGYLYFQSGDPSAARAAFVTESQHFPESKQFMDRLISKIDNK